MAQLSSLKLFRNLKSVFLGERGGIRTCDVTVSRIGFFRKPVECKESRIGKRSIEVPDNVTIALNGQDLKVKGPLGELSRTYPREVKLEREESGHLKVSKAMDTRRANQMHGLFSALYSFDVSLSYSECNPDRQHGSRGLKGFEKRLQLVGVGYRAMLRQRPRADLGFSHPSGWPSGGLQGSCRRDKEWRPPEPYKGKGVKYADEVVRRKEGKPEEEVDIVVVVVVMVVVYKFP
ncbi:50S ribosomal protein L6, chloroplastic [Ananas comosus]|uniref:50S ribosomal protein L6, chloroplastic n=1 Tax=Ananas comosus TaxID=4615 RepID=A0A199VFH5_ANACO|nr:50S ribosomal protein L6, chloroplastic [Ananas comosus]